MISWKVILFYVLMVSFAFSIVSPTSAQTLLQVTSPSNSSGIPVYQEGQTYTITLWADPSVQNIAVMTQFPLPDPQATAIPLQFTLTLPTNITPGIYNIGAMGFTSSSDVEAAPAQVDVERQDAPVSLSAKPTFVTISSIGSSQPSNVLGTFADGSTLSLKNSTLITYTSDTPSVVTIAANGVMTAVGPGYATITIQYGVIGQPGWTATTFQVTVPPPPPSGPAPLVSSVTPASGTPGVTQVTITGSNFGASQGSGFVQLGNLDATTISSWANTEIVATVPSGSMSGAAAVNQNGLYSNQIPFTTVEPSITSVTPISGTGGTQITITGTNFGATQGSSTILFNGALTSATSWNNSSIVATMSAYATSGNLVVIVNGVPSNAVAFTTSPSITSLTPASGSAGLSVTIAGSNFGLTQGASTVTFNGLTAVPTSWSAISIAAPVPATTTTGPVIVTVNGTPSNPSTFTLAANAAGLNGSNCNGEYTGTYNGNLTVVTGQTCTLTNGGVTGNLTQNGGTVVLENNSFANGTLQMSAGNLMVSNSTIGNNLQINGGGSFSIGPGVSITGNLEAQNLPAGAGTNQVCGVTVQGNLQFQNSGTAVAIGSGAGCAGNGVGGNLQVQNNTAATTIDSNTVSGNLTDQNNTAATQVYTNIITNSLQCNGNSSISGGGNTANGGKQGQCATF